MKKITKSFYQSSQQSDWRSNIEYEGYKPTALTISRNGRYSNLFFLPLQEPTLDVLVADWGNVLGRQTGLWSTEAKVWGTVPKAAWHWGGDSSVANYPFGAPGSNN
jgi:hypothetical protein